MVLWESIEKRQWPGVRENGLWCENWGAIPLADDKVRGKLNILETLGKKSNP